VIELVDGMGSISRADLTPDVEDPGYGGCFILGPECGKKVPVEYRKKWVGGSVFGEGWETA
jgi:hypothetical protein